MSDGPGDGRERAPDSRRVPDSDRETTGGGRLLAGVVAGLSTKPVLAGIVAVLLVLAVGFLLAGLLFLAQFVLVS